MQNLRRLAQTGKEIIIRIPVIPGVNDEEENIAAAGEFVSSLGSVTRIDLLPHHNAAHAKARRLAEEYELMQVDPPTAEKMETIKETLEDLGLAVKIGG